MHVYCLSLLQVFQQEVCWTLSLLKTISERDNWIECCESLVLVAAMWTGYSLVLVSFSSQIHWVALQERILGSMPCIEYKTLENTRSI